MIKEVKVKILQLFLYILQRQRFNLIYVFFIISSLLPEEEEQIPCHASEKHPEFGNIHPVLEEL